jgi:hypothetical protein
VDIQTTDSSGPARTTCPLRTRHPSELGQTVSRTLLVAARMAITRVGWTLAHGPARTCPIPFRAAHDPRALDPRQRVCSTPSIFLSYFAQAGSRSSSGLCQQLNGRSIPDASRRTRPRTAPSVRMSRTGFQQLCTNYICSSEHLKFLNIGPTLDP